MLKKKIIIENICFNKILY